MLVSFSILLGYGVFDLCRRPAKTPSKTRTGLRTVFPTDFPTAVKHPLVSLNGAFQRAIGRRTVSNTKNLDVVRLSDGSLAGGITLTSPSKIADAAAETADVIVELSRRLESIQRPSGTGIPLLFVLCPAKVAPGDGRLPQGVSCPVNDIADAVLRHLDAAGVPYLDLRAKILETGIPYGDFFFRTDHHWLPRTGLWAAAAVARKIGEITGIAVDEAVFAPAGYEEGLKGEKSFLGSLGKRTGAGYAGLDDFSYPVPTFATDLELETLSLRHGKTKMTRLRGPFLEALRDPKFEKRGIYVANPYSAILSGNRPFQRVINHGESNGAKVLLLKDSFALCVAPYLALSCGEVDLVDCRYMRGLSFLDIAARERPDIVAIIVNAGSTGSPKAVFHGVFEADSDFNLRPEQVEAGL